MRYCTSIRYPQEFYGLIDAHDLTDDRSVPNLGILCASCYRPLIFVRGYTRKWGGKNVVHPNCFSHRLEDTPVSCSERVRKLGEPKKQYEVKKVASNQQMRVIQRHFWKMLKTYYGSKLPLVSESDLFRDNEGLRGYSKFLSDTLTVKLLQSHYDFISLYLFGDSVPAPLLTPPKSKSKSNNVLIPFRDLQIEWLTTLREYTFYGLHKVTLTLIFEFLCFKRNQNILQILLGTIAILFFKYLSEEPEIAREIFGERNTFYSHSEGGLAVTLVFSLTLYLRSTCSRLWYGF